MSRIRNKPVDTPKIIARLLAVSCLGVVLVSICATGMTQEARVGGAARLESWQQNRRAAISSPFKNLKWQRLGPKFAGDRIESKMRPAASWGLFTLALEPAESGRRPMVV